MASLKLPTASNWLHAPVLNVDTVYCQDGTAHMKPGICFLLFGLCSTWNPQNLFCAGWQAVYSSTQNQSLMDTGFLRPSWFARHMLPSGHEILIGAP